MASDLISRGALLEDLRESINWLHKIYGGLEYEDEKRICGAEIASFTEVGMRVKDAPAVDAESVRHGEWLSTALVDQKGRIVVEQYKCSLCGRQEYQKEPYCHCGAKMDGGIKK